MTRLPYWSALLNKIQSLRRRACDQFQARRGNVFLARFATTCGRDGVTFYKRYHSDFSRHGVTFCKRYHGEGYTFQLLGATVEKTLPCTKRYDVAGFSHFPGVKTLRRRGFWGGESRDGVTFSWPAVLVHEKRYPVACF